MRGTVCGRVGNDLGRTTSPFLVVRSGQVVPTPLRAIAWLTLTAALDSVLWTLVDAGAWSAVGQAAVVCAAAWWLSLPDASWRKPWK